jgi:UDP-N-acetylglucosamine--N-acetylmuramyl-(pentapeptide) pyrophosphoryl-undecaprenol N-acetylglucosamine transferase
MKLLIAGGGTGGHIFPAIAIAKEFVATAPTPRVLWAGTARGLEAQLVPRAGYSLFVLSASAMRGKRWRTKLGGFIRLPVALLQAVRLIQAYNPACILCVGGYASAAVGCVALLMRIPLVVEEQNAIPGITNRWLGKFADRVVVAFENSRHYFPTRRVEVVGLPVRREILAVPPPRLDDDERPLNILVLGGSQGAQSLNRAMTNAIVRLSAMKRPPFIIQQTGVADHRWVREAYGNLRYRAEVHPFIDDMAGAYQRADLIISRAGSSVLEMALTGRGMILIPYPYAADQHQLANAQYLVERGAARLVADREFNGERCVQIVQELDANRDTLRAMAKTAANLNSRNAAMRIATVCREVAHA